MRPHPQIVAVDMRPFGNRHRRLPDDLAIAQHLFPHSHIAERDLVATGNRVDQRHAKFAQDLAGPQILQRDGNSIFGVQPDGLGWHGEILGDN